MGYPQKSDKGTIKLIIKLWKYKGILKRAVFLVVLIVGTLELISAIIAERSQ